MVSKVAIGIIAILVIAAISAAVILSTGSGTSGSSSGKMALMATDPTSSGSNTREYEHYYNEEAHRSGSSSGSGWVMLNATGTLQLNALVNASQTVVIANVQAGTYDSIRFLFDSATVTYNGQNYTAKMSYSQITANLATSAQVSGSATAVILFDLRTVAINAGSTSSPNFVVTSSARADVVSSSDVSSASLQVGARIDLSTSAWFQSFARSSARLQLSAAAISSNSLSVKVGDAGSESSNVTFVIVTPLSVLGSAQVVIPGSLDGSAVFTVGAGGTLTSATSLLAQLSSPGAGASVTSSSSATLTYSGTIRFGSPPLAVTTVTAGQSYLITVIGSNSVASTTVTAA